MERFRLGSNCTRLIVSILVFLFVLSCGTAAPPEDTEAPPPAATSTPAATEPSQPADAAQPTITATAVPAATPTEVSLTEYDIEMSNPLYAIEELASFPAGSQTFRVTNNGTTEHNFEVEGQGIEEAFETNLSPGETQTMQLNLEPGTYEVYCPVGNHREQGMEMQLTVTQ
jgi:plastocyanin